MSKLIKSKKNNRNFKLEQITLLSYVFMLNYEENCICYKPDKNDWYNNYFIPDSFSTRLTLFKFNNIFDSNFNISSELNQEQYALNIYFLLKLNLLNNINLKNYKNNKLPFIKVNSNKIFAEIINIYGLDSNDFIFIIKEFIKENFNNNSQIEINSKDFKNYLFKYGKFDDTIYMDLI